jgi:hypothetical protein
MANEKYKYIEQSFPPQIPESKFEPPNIRELDIVATKQLVDFSALLDTLSSIEEKKKALWRQIYENAVTDRKNAYLLFGDLYKDVHMQPAQHAIHGNTLAKYLERMEKSNQQLIKLAELIDQHATAAEDSVITEDDIYEQINNKRQ